MNFAEFLILTYLYKSVPAQSRHVAAMRVKTCVFILVAYLYNMPSLTQKIARNIAHPDSFRVKTTDIYITDENSLQNAFTNPMYFDTLNRIIYLNNYIINWPRNQNSAQLVDYFKVFSEMARAHQFRHVHVNKYASSMFFSHRNFYYIQVLSEIGSIIAEQVAYARMPVCPMDSCTISAHRVHNKILNRPDFKRNGITDIYDKRYRDTFQRAFATDKFIYSLMLSAAIDRFNENTDWYDSIREHKQYQVIFTADFYRWPISFNQARRKILTYDIGGKSVCLYDAMTPKARAWFDRKIYTMVDKMIKNSR